MTPSDIKAWREAMHYTHRQAAEALGVQLVSYQRMERGADFASGKPVSIDLRTALACAALAAGLPPWPAPAAPRRSRRAGKPCGEDAALTPCSGDSGRIHSTTPPQKTCASASSAADSTALAVLRIVAMSRCTARSLSDHPRAISAPLMPRFCASVP